MSEITKQKGFALPTAIFLLVVLSILAVSLITVNIYSQKTIVNDSLESKAIFVAKSGIDYGAFLASKNDNCPTTPQTIVLNELYLDSFKFTYTCEKNIVNEAGVSKTYYSITSYGCNSLNNSCPDNIGRPSREDYVEKSLTLVTSN